MMMVVRMISGLVYVAMHMDMVVFATMDVAMLDLVQD
jgi:hypothetical protein